MKLFKKVRTREETLMSQVFSIAALGFLMVTLVGVATYYAINSTGVGETLRNGGIGDAYRFGSLSGMGLVSKLSIVSMVLVMGSGVLQFIWFFRIQKASKAFIYITYTAFIIGQGIGFGYLFLTFQASELFIIFGTTAVLFGSMALSGYVAKDLSWLGKHLFMGCIATILMSLVLVILTSTGVLSLGRFGVGTILFDVLYFLGTLLIMAYIMWTTWRVKQLSEYDKMYGLDKDVRFRYIAFFAFRLMSDAVSLVWYIARFVARMRS